MPALRRYATLLVFAGLLAGACSGGGGGPSTPTPTPTKVGGSSTPSETGSSPAATGLYEYVNAGLTATFDVNADTLAIQNKTGRELPKPDLYVLTADKGARIDGKVVDAAPVPDGQTVTFDVSFPPAFDLKNVGLLILLMGSDNYGAFVQQ